MASLVIREGNDPGKTFLLGTRALTIGRGVANLIQVVDAKASRRHALIRWNEGTYTIQDLKSQNGLLVNEQTVSQVDLAMGDRIRVGGTVLELVEDRAGSGDATLDRRVTDKDVVAKSTIPDRSAAKSQASSEFVVDLDTAASTIDMTVIQASNAVRAYVERGEPPERCYDKALSGISQCLSPDRIILFEVTANRKAQSTASEFSADIPADRRTVAPHQGSIKRCLDTSAAIVDNDGGDEIGSAAAVPVIGIDGSVAALIYVDSLRENRQVYVDEDVTLLTQVADALRGLYAR